MLLKTHVEKMSVFRLSMMFMKTSELNRCLHYVDEKKDSYRRADLAVLREMGNEKPLLSLFERTAAILPAHCRLEAVATSATRTGSKNPHPGNWQAAHGQFLPVPLP